ncbi:TPA: hypothetical protein ACH3X1_011228 [Trebouxia sp. C0004]
MESSGKIVASSPRDALGSQMVLVQNDAGYWNATSMATQGNKAWTAYRKTKVTQDFIARYMDELGVPKTDLIYYEEPTRKGQGGVTWVRRRIALHFLGGLSAGFANWAFGVIESYIDGKITTEESKAAKAGMDSLLEDGRIRRARKTFCLRGSTRDGRDEPEEVLATGRPRDGRGGACPSFLSCRALFPLRLHATKRNTVYGEGRGAATPMVNACRPEDLQGLDKLRLLVIRPSVTATSRDERFRCPVPECTYIGATLGHAGDCLKHLKETKNDPVGHAEFWRKTFVCFENADGKGLLATRPCYDSAPFAFMEPGDDKPHIAYTKVRGADLSAAFG